MCKAWEDYGFDRELKGREEERMDAIRNMIRYGVSKETILRDYSEEEYEKAEQDLLVHA